MQLNRDEILRDLYNLLLNKGTREWERNQLNKAKDALEKGTKFEDQLELLEVAFRPLASRNNLTPDVADFYLKIKADPTGDWQYDFSQHVITDFNEVAVFAGGCFWCMVEPFETRSGIISVLSGYTGGGIDSPTYDQVSGGDTNHVEAVEIIFDPRIISYAELLTLYWQLIDPTDAFGQFQDRGSQYRPIIFVQTDEQRAAAEKSKKELSESGRYLQPIVTEIKQATIFWAAENYHQQFYQKQKKRYKHIKQARQQLLIYQHVKEGLRLKLSRHREKHKLDD
ncbi:peptide-methionine (S)-S-oxide reductase MsrA [uncultured Vagococcus sp.]|uniref:peptide-methionine (S)-S-oxide reductase MsrA n=1 Tax=uncultured Vagococcus sp. TaxID=189676 RepID=UPI0028D7F909|nr:peptide-methionine (S)-S-oxide reductase MsrA [uncultured Vagococcus sp.]